MKPCKILAHFVLYKSPSVVRRAIQSLLEQEIVGAQITILISDNYSQDGLIDELEKEFDGSVQWNRNSANLGFAAAQNLAVTKVLSEHFDYLFLVNADSRYEKDCVSRLITALENDPSSGTATPLLYRANEDLSPVSPTQIDAAGMVMTRSLRHLDREEFDGENLNSNQYVFGGTGAALMLKRSCIESLLLDTPDYKQALYRVYPQLREGAALRAALFDEAFFAFREDADLAWRAQLFGWSCIFVPSAVGYHVRHVLPERRAQLSPLINSWGVRNRFLMQVNNFSFIGMSHCLVPGLLVRNSIVLAAVLLTEWRSLQGVWEFLLLLPRAVARRREVFRRARADRQTVANWFR